MKREIKFRAWEYTHERTHGEAWRDTPMIWKMNYTPKVYGDEILGGYSEVNLNYALNNGGDDSLINNEHPTIFMQYTGVKDKNGKEVYEGDIIKNADGDLRQIMWAVNGFEMRLMNGNRPNDSTIWYLDVEIFGNIYENPELLKQS